MTQPGRALDVGLGAGILVSVGIGVEFVEGALVEVAEGFAVCVALGSGALTQEVTRKSMRARLMGRLFFI